ncbi:MAG: hypothetical protein MUC85_00510, partial [Anaerolineales bacterium]|nr:hypothetical protein [Anaerolineales bacterium]
MRKLFVLAMVLVLTFASVTPAAAKGGAFQLYGKITAIDADNLTFTILVETPLRYAEDTITVQVTDATRIKECSGTISYRISFDGLQF